MSKITLNGFVLLFLLFLGNSSGELRIRLRHGCGAQGPIRTNHLHRASLPALVFTKAGPARFKK